MKCAQCGHLAPEDAHICPQCGLVLAAATPVGGKADGEVPADAVPHLILPDGYDPVALTAPAEPAAAVPPTDEPKTAPPAARPPHKGRGCLMGCLGVLGVFGVVILLGLALVFDLPARMGLAPSAASRMLVATPDDDARAVMLEEFRALGQPTQGLLIYVLPYKNSSDTLAYVVLDQSKGFHYVITNYGDPISAALIHVARSKAAGPAHVVRVAVEFREVDGKTLFVVTAPVEAIRQYGDRTITKKQFFAQLEGHGNFARIYRNQLDFVRGAQWSPKD